MRFCVYEHWRPDTDQCFYVGKGTLQRARKIRRKENQWHARIVAKLATIGLLPQVIIVASGLAENEAFSLECERISYWRSIGGVLVNCTTGGEGAAGKEVSPETREKIRAGLIGKSKGVGRKLSPKHRSAISDGLRGRQVSQETRTKISAAQAGRPRPDQIGRKISPEAIQRLRDRTFSPEHRRKISEAKKGVPQSPEHVAAVAAARRGKMSAQARENIRASRVAFIGKPRPESVRLKISLAKKGKPGRKGLVPWCKGKHLSAETREKMSAAHRGKKRGPMSLVQKQKIRQTLLGRKNVSLKGKPLSEEHRQKLVDAWKRRRLRLAERANEQVGRRSPQAVQDPSGGPSSLGAG